MEFVYNKKEKMPQFMTSFYIVYMFVRNVRGLNSWPPAWQAGILTNWTNVPKLNKIQKKVSLRAAANESISSKLRLRVYKNLGESFPSKPIVHMIVGYHRSHNTLLHCR